jgi:TRAP-type C4-dicarboxylate transport system substrate-binding protein
VDVALISIATIDSNTVLNNIFSTMIPDLPPSGLDTAAMFNKLVEEEPSLNAEMESSNLRWLSLHPMPNLNIHLAKKVLKKPEDIKGQKIEGLGAVSSKYLENIGATTVTLDSGDYYLSCERGVVDGMLTHWACVNDFKLNEVLHYHTIFGEMTEEYPSGNGLAADCMGWIVNLDTWNKLSEEQQGWIYEAFQFCATRSVELDAESALNGYKTCVEQGDTFENIKGDDLKPWYDAMQTPVDEWVKNCEKAGFDNAKEVREKLLSILEEYKS